MKTFIIFLLLTIPAANQPWPQTLPKIGRLELKQEYVDYIKAEARRYQISPYLTQAVCAIESGYDPEARSGRGISLMQAHPDTVNKHDVDSHTPRRNIMGGAAFPDRLMQKYCEDLRRVF